MAVVIRPIKAGEELLVDYGPNYWCGQYHGAPTEPPGIDDLVNEEEEEAGEEA